VLGGSLEIIAFRSFLAYGFYYFFSDDQNIQSVQIIYIKKPEQVLSFFFLQKKFFLINSAELYKEENC